MNYTPLYYLINGVGFDKTHRRGLAVRGDAGHGRRPVTGTVLVRLVNAGCACTCLRSSAL